MSGWATHPNTAGLALAPGVLERALLAAHGPVSPAPLRIATLVCVVEAVLDPPADGADRVDHLMPLLEGLARAAGVVLHTTADAQGALAETLGTDVATLDDRLETAPADRSLLERAFARPEHHGCQHLQEQLRRKPLAADVLKAFLRGRHAGWPGLEIAVGRVRLGDCCCGEPLARAPRARPFVDAVDI